MAGLYVPLDVDYATDDKLIEAGPMAELLYVRSLCFAKRTMRDGQIARSQLAAVALGIPSAAKHAQRLVDVGAWTASKTGWTITAWLKHNKPAASIRADSEAKKAASLLANHERWHVGEGRKRSATCPLCNPRTDPTSHPDSDPNPDPASESTESEGRQSEDRVRGKTERKMGTQDDSLRHPQPCGQLIDLDERRPA
ncbi:MAG: hypothetical protein WKF64_08440 [Ilumatobacteraceae bacterium]